MPWAFFVLTHLSIDVHSQIPPGGEAPLGGMHMVVIYFTSNTHQMF